MDKFIYRMGFGESLDEVCEKFACDPICVMQDNGLKREDIGEGVRLVLTPNAGRRHIVKPFETIERLSRFYGVSIEELQKKNNIKEVFLGQTIYI